MWTAAVILIEMSSNEKAFDDDEESDVERRIDRCYSGTLDPQRLMTDVKSA